MSAEVTEEDAGAFERERCALLAEQLATMWEATAKRIRVDGSRYSRGIWPFKKRWHVTPSAERSARDIEAAAHVLRAIALGCREGWDPRKIKEPQPLSDWGQV